MTLKRPTMKSAACPLPHPLFAFGRPFFLLGLLAGALAAPRAYSEEPHAASTATKAAPASAAAPASSPVRTNIGGTRKEIESTIREAVGTGDPTKKRLNLIVPPGGDTADDDRAQTHPVATPTAAPVASRLREPGVVVRAQPKPRPNARPAAPAPAPHKNIHWSYEGEGGPAHWGQLKPEYKTCAIGKRQSPIHIEDTDTLRGPAEPIRFRYAPSKGTVINNGHTIQVHVYGDNSIVVRGTTYQLLQFHFHHPSEERINGQGYPMVGHFVHRNDAGQLAVVAVLLEEGTANALIQNVWTYMPLDVNDSVRMPPDLVDVNLILPQDQRYYQFMGSLTTPPCTEGVLWLVLKQPVTVSRSQLRLFSQLYANNARPVQPAHGRPIRDAVQLQAVPAPGPVAQ